MTSLGLADKVALEGHRSDIAPFLMSADIFLIPSLWEGFGLVAVEGMNAGLPVIAANVSGLREVVGLDGKCAILVPPTDAQAIAAAVKDLIKDVKKRCNIGEAAFERSKLFDKRRMTEEYIEAYKVTAQKVAYA